MDYSVVCSSRLQTRPLSSEKAAAAREVFLIRPAASSCSESSIFENMLGISHHIKAIESKNYPVEICVGCSTNFPEPALLAAAANLGPSVQW